MTELWPSFKDNLLCNERCFYPRKPHTLRDTDSEFLNFGAICILGRRIFFSFSAWGLLCVVWCLAPSLLLLTRCQQHPPAVVTTHISRHCPMSRGAKTGPAEDHCTNRSDPGAAADHRLRSTLFLIFQRNWVNPALPHPANMSLSTRRGGHVLFPEKDQCVP